MLHDDPTLGATAPSTATPHSGGRPDRGTASGAAEHDAARQSRFHRAGGGTGDAVLLARLRLGPVDRPGGRDQRDARSGQDRAGGARRALAPRPVPGPAHLSLRGHDAEGRTAGAGGGARHPAAQAGRARQRRSRPRPRTAPRCGGSCSPAAGRSSCSTTRSTPTRSCRCCPAPPGSLVLVTTRRERSSCPACCPLPLDPMPPADAGALFTRTADMGKVADQAAVASVAAAVRIPAA